MKRLVFAAALVAALALSAEENKEEKNYVSFVNVAEAVEPTLFANSVTNFLLGVFPARVRLVSAESVDVVSIMNPQRHNEKLGKDTRLAVYFVKDPAFPPQLTAPGMWAIINVRNLEKGADKKRLTERIHRMVLKGLAFACGFGANQDRGRCVMGAGSFSSLEGIDGTSASYSPFVMFPMMDFMSAHGLIMDMPPVGE